jgi:type VI secretion system secreted protein Hcp
MAEVILDIPDIQGECMTVGFENKISVNSMSLTNEIPITFKTENSTRTVGTVKIGDIELQRNFDKASIPIIQKMIAGKSLGTVKISILKAAADKDGHAQDVFMTYTLTDAMIANHVFASEEDTPPTETITMNFAAIQWEYFWQKQDGTLGGKIPAGYNCLSGKPI